MVLNKRKENKASFKTGNAPTNFLQAVMVQQSIPGKTEQTRLLLGTCELVQNLALVDPNQAGIQKRPHKSSILHIITPVQCSALNEFASEGHSKCCIRTTSTTLALPVTPGEKR